MVLGMLLGLWRMAVLAEAKLLGEWTEAPAPPTDRLGDPKLGCRGNADEADGWVGIWIAGSVLLVLAAVIEMNEPLDATGDAEGSLMSKSYCSRSSASS